MDGTHMKSCKVCRAIMDHPKIINVAPQPLEPRAHERPSTAPAGSSGLLGALLEILEDTCALQPEPAERLAE